MPNSVRSELESLLLRARSGDAQATEELLARHDEAVRRSISINPKWRSVIDEDDLLQVTYLEAVLDLPSYAGDAGGFEAWLRAIARNNLRDLIRGLEREKRPNPNRRVDPVASNGSVLEFWNMLTGSAPTPSGEAAINEIRATLESRLDELPPTYATVVRLVHFHGRGFDEAALAMERSYGAVYLLHRRALDRLRELLGAESRFFSG